MLLDITEPDDSQPHCVRVDQTHVGKGVFAMRTYPATAIIGEIKGELVSEPYGSPDYSFDFEAGLQLEPAAPFRYLNHCCEPNCEFDILDQPALSSGVCERKLFLIALRLIEPGEELTIAYNWPASSAIACHCNSENCVGWIVCESEIDQIADYYDDDFEQVPSIRF